MWSRYGSTTGDHAWHNSSLLSARACGSCSCSLERFNIGRRCKTVVRLSSPPDGECRLAYTLSMDTLNIPGNHLHRALQERRMKPGRRCLPSCQRISRAGWLARIFRYYLIGYLLLVQRINFTNFGKCKLV